MKNADVTVLMPVYKSVGFVAESIESVLSQSYDNFKLHISVDPSDDGTVALCQEYKRDPRVTVSVNDNRLGWVGNTNACLDRVDTPFMICCFHDDTLLPSCLETLVPKLKADREAVSAFGAIERVRETSSVHSRSEIRGTPASRAKACLTGAPPAYGLKSLLRSDLVLKGLRLPEIGKKGFRADLPFSLAYSLAGDFVSSPEIVYRKTLSDSSVTADWHRSDAEQYVHDSTLLQTHLLRVIKSADLEFWERKELVQLVLANDGSQFLTDVFRLNSLSDAGAVDIPAFLITSLMIGDEETSPDSPEIKALRGIQAEDCLVRARRFQKWGDPVSALFYARRSARMNDASAGAHELSASLMLAFAGRIEGSEQDVLDMALVHAQRATEIDPNNPSPQLLLAQIRGAMAEPDGVVKPIERAKQTAVGRPSLAKEVADEERLVEPTRLGSSWRRWVAWAKSWP